MPPTRRELFRLCGAAALATRLPACGDNLESRVFTNAELELLRTFADAVLPPDDQPGGVELGAVPFIERLCLAFESSPPAFYAGGPFSDRHTDGPNDFATFVELDRVAEAKARLRVLGSAGLAGGAPNEALLGPVLGLAAQLEAGLAAAAAMRGSLTGPELFDAQPDDFKSLLIDLVSEAAFAAPEYGGNPDGAGWRMCHFEGDVLPAGHSAAAVSEPDAVDPEPLTRDVTDVIDIVISVLGGRVRA